MVKVTYVEHDGVRHEVEARPGLTLREVAIQGGINAIEGECGGACACATCHIYVPADWQPLTGSASANELAMLECANDPDDRSRLGCQITLTAEMDGLTVLTPRSQR
ncbi:2Fe-2S iron-sulfur cluster-binding family protein [Terricaulis silvestris]|uniref:Ferredoxin VI n=1 Tax=Terricaulis silvestris TaxID=2686094 RepID=A0A6I6MRN7_9CAUL|nr:2Fe-2S iron-sulfur cluster-binding protein [Terricaulis silvestris]QGZ93803.1 Ferredoxin VI [Terricaulis silvestris]